MRAQTRLAALLAGVLTLALAACGSSDEAAPSGGATTGAAQAGDLKPLADGFPNKTITLLNAAEPDNDDGIYARQLQAAVKKLVDVDVRVLDRPDFGTYGSWEALAWQAEQPGGNEGYIAQVVAIPGSTFDLLATPVTKELGSTLDTMNVVGITESAPYVIISRKGAPWGKSFADMIAYGKANPGKLRYISRGPGAGPDMAFTNYITTAGVKVKTSIGGSHAEQNTAIGAGQADVAVTVAGQVSPFLQRVEVLACTGPGTSCKGPWGEAPTAASVVNLERDIWGSNRGLAVTEKTPAEHREWLEALLREAVKDEAFLKARGQIPGLTQKFLDHDEARDLSEFGLQVGRELLEPLGLIHESVKSG